tara:strand:+ start:131 stop:355 length:225 start_codon:yes stop_codon:yes gene_type:complete
MFLPLKKVLYGMIFNSSLFLLLMIGIQNSSNRRKVNFIIKETVSLPISFIVGVSFISGSITGNFLTTYTSLKKK